MDPWRDAAVLPGAVQRVLVRVPALRHRPARMAHRQLGCSCRRVTAAVARTSEDARARRVARRAAVGGASDVQRECGVGHRGKEHLLDARDVRVGARVVPRARCGGGRPLCGRPADARRRAHRMHQPGRVGWQYGVLPPRDGVQDHVSGAARDDPCRRVVAGVAASEGPPRHRRDRAVPRGWRSHGPLHGVGGVDPRGRVRP